MRNYFVSPTGLDSNPGSESLPFRTLQKGFDVAKNNRVNDAVTLQIAPGIYREAILSTTGAFRSTNKLIVKAQQPGTVTVTGADIFSNWTADSADFWTAWTHRLGTSSQPWGSYGPNQNTQAVVYRKEVLTVNRKPYQQVNRRAELRAGTFCVDETAGRVYLRPQAGDTITAANTVVEISVRNRCVDIVKVNNLEFDGIEFLQSACEIGEAGFKLNMTENVSITRCAFDLHNYGGFYIHNSQDFKIIDCRANDNGNNGFHSNYCDRYEVAFCEALRNNWKGRPVNWYEWDSGGIKFVHSPRGKFHDLRIWDNECLGIWLDFASPGCEFWNLDVRRNFWAGMFLEAHRRGMHRVTGTVATVKDSYFAGTRSNGKHRSPFPQGDPDYGNADIMIVASDDLVFENVLIDVGDYAGIMVTNADPIRQISVGAWNSDVPNPQWQAAGGALFDLKNHQFKGLKIVANSAEKRLIAVREHPNAGDPVATGNTKLASYTLQNCQLWNAATAQTFRHDYANVAFAQFEPLFGTKVGNTFAAFTLTAPTNPPGVRAQPQVVVVADAGPDIVMEDNDWDNIVPVLMDGKGSRAEGDQIIDYKWHHADGTLLGNGSSPVIDLPTGEHNIVLTVTTVTQQRAQDSVVVMARPRPNNAPIAAAGPDIVIVDADADGWATVQLDGSGSSDDFRIAAYKWLIEDHGEVMGSNPSVTLPVGTHKARLTVVDEAGLEDSDTVNIVINPPAAVTPTGGTNPTVDVTMTQDQVIEVQIMLRIRVVSNNA